jgi:hypothetical protein
MQPLALVVGSYTVCTLLKGKMTRRNKKKKLSPSDINRKHRKASAATNRELVLKFAKYREKVGGSFNAPQIK